MASKTKSALVSRLYSGSVRHSRGVPIENTFKYQIFMLYIDLDELAHLFDGFVLWSSHKINLAWFRRSDYLGDKNSSLDVAVRELVRAHTGKSPSGPIRLLTNLRYFFYRSNPVSFYYVFKKDGVTLETIVAEVTNTPWDEKFCYVLDLKKQSGDNGKFVYTSEKGFHVSPFMPMDMTYQWKISSPCETLLVRIQSLREGERWLDVALNLEAQPVSSLNLARCLMVYPFLTMKVSLAIYWQALKLFIKRVAFHPHPNKLNKS